VTKENDKVSFKVFSYIKRRRVAGKWFKVQTNCKFITFNYKTNALYTGSLDNYHLKRKCRKRVSRVMFNNDPINNMRRYLRDGLNTIVDKDKVDIPTIINQLIANKKYIKLGNLNPTRDFSYVEDVANAFYKVLISKKCIGKIINIGSNFEISIKKIVYLVLNILKIKNIKIIFEKVRARKKTSEVFRLYSSNLLAKKKSFTRKLTKKCRIFICLRRRNTKCFDCS
jgi:hypothetical protein